MIDRPDDIAQRILTLRSIFSETEPFHALQAEFARQIGGRRAEIEAGRTLPVKGIALIGASGSGKSTLVGRLLRVTPDLVLAQHGLNRCDVISLTIPSPATLKFVGRAILEALGYPLKRERTADAIWELVRGFLKERQVLFLHLDEAQDIARHQTPKEMQAVINTLKTMMQHPSWPVGLILSGMPALRDMLNFDPQLARRVIPIELPRLSPIGDIEPLTEMTAFYAQEGGLAPADAAKNADIAARLIQAADREFGLAIEITIDAIEVALRAGSAKPSRDHFAAAFARRSGCIDGLNALKLAGDLIDANCLPEEGRSRIARAIPDIIEEYRYDQDRLSVPSMAELPTVRREIHRLSTIMAAQFPDLQKFVDLLKDDPLPEVRKFDENWRNSDD